MLAGVVALGGCDTAGKDAPREEGTTPSPPPAAGPNAGSPSSDEAHKPESVPAAAVVPTTESPSSAAAADAGEATPPKTLEDPEESGAAGEPAQAKNGRVDYELAEEETFGLVALAVATGLDDRQPTGTADSFGLAAGTLTGWAEVRNTDAETAVTMVWSKDGKEKARTEVKVGVSPGWRTWTRKRLGKRDAGDWQLEVLDAEGASLGKLEFAVTNDLPLNCPLAGGECMEGCEPGWTEYRGKVREGCFDSVCCVKKKKK